MWVTMMTNDWTVAARDAAVARAEKAEARAAELEAEAERLRSGALCVAVRPLEKSCFVSCGLPADQCACYRGMMDRGHLTIRPEADVRAEGFAPGWAAAIEAAASCCSSSGYAAEQDGYHFAYTIRSIPMPADAAAALDRLTAQVRAQGMREAAEIVRARIPALHPEGPVSAEQQVEYEALGFAMQAVLARAEEIEKEARNG